VHTVGSHHQVGAMATRQRYFVRHVGIEHERHAGVFAARLQDAEQVLARDAAKTMAMRRDGGAADLHVDRIPAVERPFDGARTGRIGQRQIAQRLVRKHDAPAERVAGLVALDDRHAAARVAQFHEQAGVQAGRPATDADDVHGLS
jgi:hypothetical protein